MSNKYEGKPCSKCGRIERYFSNGRCVYCQTNAAKDWYNDNRHTRSEYKKVWYQANKEIHDYYCKTWVEANRDRHKATKRAWAKDNIELVRSYETGGYFRKKTAEAQAHMLAVMYAISEKGAK